MAETLRRSVTLPARTARRVDSIAQRERVSANRVIADLIESGLESREREKREFFELADRLADSSDPAEQRRLKKDLARLTYGDEILVSDSEMSEIRSDPALRRRLKRGRREAAGRRGRFV